MVSANWDYPAKIWSVAGFRLGSCPAHERVSLRVHIIPDASARTMMFQRDSARGAVPVDLTSAGAFGSGIRAGKPEFRSCPVTQSSFGFSASARWKGSDAEPTVFIYLRKRNGGGNSMSDRFPHTFSSWIALSLSKELATI